MDIDFLKKKDIKIIDPKYVFYGPCRPTHTYRAECKFDDEKALDLYKNSKRVHIHLHSAWEIFSLTI